MSGLPELMSSRILIFIYHILNTIYYIFHHILFMWSFGAPIIQNRPSSRTSRLLVPTPWSGPAQRLIPSYSHDVNRIRIQKTNI